MLEFAALVIVISASGVMSPGPLFTANVFYGLKGGLNAGLKMAGGHTVVELPLVILLGIGALSLESIPELRVSIVIIGAIGLFVFAGFQLRKLFSYNLNDVFQTKQGPFLAGILLSALNPFFIIWWFTIGLKLISDALLLWSFWGIGIMFLLHIWMDFAWLSTTALLSSKVTKILSNKSFKALLIGLNIVLIYFGVTFLIEGLA